jgi:C-terminal processing protease CtpA/Prc
MSSSAQRYLDEALDLMATKSVDRRRVDWAALRRELTRQFAGAQTPADTYPAIYAALATLGNPHSTLLPPPVTGRAPQFPGADSPGRVPRGTPLAPDLAQLVLPGVFGLEQTVLEYVRAGTAEVAALDAAGACGWIVDLREDDGGNMWPMLAVVAPLLGAGTLGFFEDADRRRTPWGLRDGAPVLDDKPFYTQLRHEYRLRRPDPPVAVLTGASTTSAGESVLIAFKGRPDTRVFGHPTAGLASANQGFPLSDGATLLLTTASNVDRVGRVYGNSPIPPDAPPSDTVAADPTVHAATAWLRQHPACAPTR